MTIREFDAKRICECIMNENTFTDFEEFIDYLNDNIKALNQVIDDSFILSYFERGCFVTTDLSKEKILMFIQDIKEYESGDFDMHNQYYTFQEVTSTGCVYHKVYCGGEGVELL